MRLDEKHFEVSTAGLEEVLQRVCSEFGYCLLGDTYDRLVDNPPATISKFIDAIITGEGLNPESITNNHRRRMRDMIFEAVERYEGKIW